MKVDAELVMRWIMMHNVNELRLFSGCYYDCDICHKYYTDGCNDYFHPATKKQLEEALKIYEDKLAILSRQAEDRIVEKFELLDKIEKIKNRLEDMRFMGIGRIK